MKNVLLCLLFIGSCIVANAQCADEMSINNITVECNGDGTSTITINVTVLFGNGNNSAVISYNLGAGEITAVNLEDDNGDIINQTYMFTVPTCDNYSVTLTAWTNPAGGGSSCTDPAPVVALVSLPVTFGHFDIINKESEIILDWSTHIEINNDKFLLQKSFDNKNFETFGEIDGAGNSHQIIKYQFVDKNTSTGTIYYKIKQVDLDGTFSFSDVRSVKVNQKSYDLNIYPNPAENYISISSPEMNSLNIVNMLGKRVRHFDNVASHQKLDISTLESGIYFIVSSDGLLKKRFFKR